MFVWKSLIYSFNSCDSCSFKKSFICFSCLILYSYTAMKDLLLSPHFKLSEFKRSATTTSTGSTSPAEPTNPYWELQCEDAASFRTCTDNAVRHIRILPLYAMSSLFPLRPRGGGGKQNPENLFPPPHRYPHNAKRSPKNIFWIITEQSHWMLHPPPHQAQTVSRSGSFQTHIVMPEVTGPHYLL